MKFGPHLQLNYNGKTPCTWKSSHSFVPFAVSWRSVNMGLENHRSQLRNGVPTRQKFGRAALVPTANCGTAIAKRPKYSNSYRVCTCSSQMVYRSRETGCTRRTRSRRLNSSKMSTQHSVGRRQRQILKEVKFWKKNWFLKNDIPLQRVFSSGTPFPPGVVQNFFITEEEAISFAVLPLFEKLVESILVENRFWSKIILFDAGGPQWKFLNF